MTGRKKPGTKKPDQASQPAKTPGDILRRSFMDPLGLSAYRVSKDVGLPPIALSQILRGQRGISASVAVRFGRYFGVPPQFWMALQAEYDLSKFSVDDPEAQVQKCAAMGDRQFAIGTPVPAGQVRKVVLPAVAIRIQARKPAAEPSKVTG